MATRVGRGKILLQYSIVHPRKLPIDAKISQISLAETETIAHFVLNFVAMATRKGRGKISLAVFDGLTLKNFL